jgi:hypothetical protein
VEDALRKFFFIFILPVVTIERRLSRNLAAIVEIPFCCSNYGAGLNVDAFDHVAIGVAMEQLQHAFASSLAPRWSVVCGKHGVYIFVVIGERQGYDFEDAGDICLCAALDYKRRHIYT